MKTKTIQERIQTARAVSPEEAEGVVDRAELYVFTNTFVVNIVLNITHIWGPESHQQSGQEKATAGRVGGWRNHKAYFRHSNKKTFCLCEIMNNNQF